MKAILRNVHISPRKVRFLKFILQGYSADKALASLTLMPQKSAKIVAKVLKSAISNAGDKKSLVISSFRVNEGIVYKRSNPVSKGAAHPIRKRTSHIHIELSETKNN